MRQAPIFEIVSSVPLGLPNSHGQVERVVVYKLRCGQHEKLSTVTGVFSIHVPLPSWEYVTEHGSRMPQRRDRR